MITPSFGLTATERVLPRLALDWTTGVAQTGVDVTRAGVATFVGSNGLIQSASVDTQRIDYSTGVAGLLVEESRTNLFTYSEAFEDPIWVKGVGLVITPNDTTAPDGTLTADLADGTGSTNFLNQIIALTSGTTYTISCYVKSAGLGKDTFRFFADTSQTSSAFTATNEWVRYTFTFTSGLTGNRNNGITRDAANNPLGIYIWGAQLEAGAFPTSYIPTEATTVTRNADVATMTGTAFSDWYSDTAGTFLAQAVPTTQLSTVTRYLIGIDSTIPLYLQQNSSLVRSFDGTTAISVAGSITAKTMFKAAVGYGGSDRVLANSQGFTASGAYDGSFGSTTLAIGSSGSNVFWNGHIQKMLYYPHKLTNAELLAITK
jgi:hypothetical protein